MLESMNQDCEQDDIASVGVEKAIGVWSRAKVFVTKRPAGVETLTFLFGKRDSAELLLTEALEAICMYIYISTTQPNYSRWQRKVLKSGIIYQSFRFRSRCTSGRATRFWRGQ